MSSPPALTLAIQHVGLVTSVGSTAPASCAALRAKISNPCESRFTDGRGEWIVAHQVALERPWSGVTRLAHMTAMAIEEALHAVPRNLWTTLPLILCVAERERPGRPSSLDTRLPTEIQQILGTGFDSARSTVVAHGRASAAVALEHARRLLSSGDIEQVVIAGADSLIAGDTLTDYESQGRLLSIDNSNGFIPGEAGGAVLVGRARSTANDRGQLLVTGLGFADEAAHISSEQPLRGEGLADAFRGALRESGHRMNEIDFRIADLSGEHYYFKEASLALSHTLRGRRDFIDLWHPAECIGETGAAAGLAMLALAEAACARDYAPGPLILAHWANDSGHRAAAALRWQGPEGSARA